MYTETRSNFRLHKICVLIPTYNNAQTLEQVVNDALRYTDQVIVVNDGSTDGTSAILEKFPNLRKVSYDKNRGKGYALRTGFAFALAEGFDYAITMDSDGPHFAADLPSFLNVLNENPESIIIGASVVGVGSQRTTVTAPRVELRSGATVYGAVMAADGGAAVR